MTTEDDSRRKKLPLHGWHEEHGARWTDSDESASDLMLPVHYGDAKSEALDASETCKLVDRSDLGRLELTGEDRVRFLNGLVTCDVAALEAGQGCYGFFTTPKGRILADVVVLAQADRLWLELPAGEGIAVREHLEKYIVADRVEVRSIDDLLLFRLLGQGVDSWLEKVGAALHAGTFAHAPATLLGTDVHASRSPLCGVPAVSLWVSSGIAGPVASDVLNEGVELVGHQAAETFRVLGAVPRFGRDFSDSNLPQETRFDAAVSYDKGCYLGQEIVARLHYRGQAARELRRVDGPGEPPAFQEELLAGERLAAVVTSSVPAPDGWQGLAMVRRAALEEATLQTADGRTVALQALPEIPAR